MGILPNLGNHRSDMIYFKRYSVLIRWRVNITSSINAIDPAIRVAANEDVNILTS